MFFFLSQSNENRCDCVSRVDVTVIVIRTILIIIIINIIIIIIIVKIISQKINRWLQLQLSEKKWFLKLDLVYCDVVTSLKINKVRTMQCFHKATFS